jgi:hypothetical protein
MIPVSCFQCVKIILILNIKPKAMGCPEKERESHGGSCCYFSLSMLPLILD